MGAVMKSDGLHSKSSAMVKNLEFGLMLHKHPSYTNMYETWRRRRNVGKCEMEYV